MLCRLLENLLHTQLIPATWLESRKGGGSVACWEVRPKRHMIFCRARARPHSGEVSNAAPYFPPKGLGGTVAWG
ncbi:hypothetical protein KSC_006250 [Ktedonobacter sp. SOSP1-52]|nr:hypothetical protein KSC_006250 [Ktedonobacter sp. SOSP1-52]